MTLDGTRYERLHHALLAAYPSPDGLAMMLQFRLSKQLAMITPAGASYPFTVFKLIEVAQADGWVDRLVAAAREDKPDNAELAEAAAALGLAVAAPGGLERMIRERHGMLDPVAWRGSMARIETQVCRVEYPLTQGRVTGTGFLVGPGLVMTNYHVVEWLIEGKAKPADVRLRFDFKRLDGGETVNPGVLHRLDDDWLVDSSPYSPLDKVPRPGKEPKPDELDYALLRAAGEPGRQPVGTTAGAAMAEKRGWITFEGDPPKLAEDTLVLIVQHPMGEPVSLAIDAVSKVSSTRVRYLTNTERGSSGSPCFDINWKLVALHHSGDPNFQPLHHPEYNQGIPIKPIYELLEKRGLAVDLAATP